MTTSHLKSATPTSASNKGPAVPPLQIYQRELANGLNILIQPDFSAPVVSIQYWCATGSIHEGRWLGGGLSHLLEHLMFKGTPSMGNSEMAQRIQDLGGHMNAYTSFDRTVYYVDLPSNNWRQALDLWTDAIQHSQIPPEEFEPEKDVIRREFAMGNDNPESVLSKLIFQSAFTTHPYRFPVIGHLDLFNQITREDVISYYRERYAPQNLTLILVGAVDPDQVFAHAEELWSKETRRWLPTPVIPDEPPQQSPRLAQRTFPTEIVRLAHLYHIPGMGHEDIPTLQILAIILGSGRSSILHHQLVEEEGLAEEIEAFAYAPAKVGLFGVEARCKPANHARLVSRLNEEMDKLHLHPRTQDELDRAKRLCLTQQMHQLKTMSGKASSIGSGWMLTKDPHFSVAFLSHLQQVSLEDLARVIKKYLHPSRETRVELIPQTGSSSSLSTEGTETRPPHPTKVSTGGANRTLYFPSEKVPLVSFRATMPGGLLHQPEGKAGLSRLTSQMLLKGTKNRTAEQLAREIEQLGGHLHADSGNNSASLSLELLSEDWSRGLDLFLDVLTEPKFIEKELITEKRKQLAAIQQEQDQPMAVCRDLLRSALFGNHPYSQSILGTQESVESITLEDIETFARTIYQNASTVFAVAGPQAPEIWMPELQQRTRPLAQRALPPTRFGFGLPDQKITQPLRVEREIPKQQAILQIAFPIPGLTHPDQIPLSLLNEALSDLGTRLFVRIREQLGLAYFVSASRFLGFATGYFVFYAGTDPKRKKQVEEAMLEEIRILAQGGLTPQEHHRARAKLLSEDKIHSQNPSSVAAGAALDELYELGYDYNLTRQHRIETLSLEELNQVVKRYLETETYVIATVSPE